MTTFTRTWNAGYESTPADTEAASLGASRIRDLKEDLRERTEVDHSWAGDADDGEHKKVTFTDPLTADPATAVNKGYLYTKDVSGVVELFWKDESGNVKQLTTGGKINNPLDMPVVVKTASFTVTAADKGKLFDIDASAAAVTVTLPAVATAGDGFVVGFKAKSVTNTITIDGNGAETIDGSTTQTLNNADDSVILTCDGTEWHIVASHLTPVYKRSAQYTYSLARGTTPTQTAADAWTKFPLNTEEFDDLGIGTLASNQITLKAGTYDVSGYAHMNSTANSLKYSTRIRDVTNGVTLVEGGSVVQGGPNTDGQTLVFPIQGRFTLAADAVVEYQHYVTGFARIGDAGSGAMGGNNKHVSITFRKVA